jgi:acyl carrier protein
MTDSQREDAMTQNAPQAGVDEVKAALVETLGLEAAADSIAAETRLLGSLPELDSMAVLELIVVLEQRFGISVSDEDVSAEAFETLATLTELVRSKQG